MTLLFPLVLMELLDGVLSCDRVKRCNRENADRGTDYCNCLSVHAEQNAIIAASRDQMIGSTLYLVGYEFKNNKTNYVKDAEPCSLCKRLIINAGIEAVVVRITNVDYSYYNVDLWRNTSSIVGGY